MKNTYYLTALTLLCAFNNAWGFEPFQLFVTGAQNAGGSLDSEIKDFSGTLIASDSVKTTSQSSFGLETRFERPTGFFYSFLLEYSKLQLEDSSVQNSILSGSGMFGMQGSGTFRPWAGAALGISATTLGRPSYTSGDYSVSAQSSALGFVVSPRVGLDWLVTRNLIVGAYAAYTLGATDIKGSVTKNSTHERASFTESDSFKCFTAGIRLGFSFGSPDHAPELPRTAATSPSNAPETPASIPGRAPASANASSESAATAKERLARLKELLDEGSITQEEFTEKRKKILNEL